MPPFRYVNFKEIAKKVHDLQKGDMLVEISTNCVGIVTGFAGDDAKWAVIVEWNTEPLSTTVEFSKNVIDAIAQGFWEIMVRK